MACLHSRNVLHGDLKAANVLLCVTEAHQEADDGSAGNNPSDDSGGLAELTAKVGGDVDGGHCCTLLSTLSHYAQFTVAQFTYSQPVLLNPNPNLWCVQVSDFGLSRMMREGASHHSTHTMGTITHQAPGGCDCGCDCRFVSGVACLFVRDSMECWHTAVCWSLGWCTWRRTEVWEVGGHS